ncbi:unnamed protein product [Discosporangium mesarthrocarpum]
MKGREKVIGEENVGHNMLKKMGWSEGTGLGSNRSGRVVPISGAGQMDKMGIGGGPAKPVSTGVGEGAGAGGDKKLGGDAFEEYRRNKSYSFRRY